MAAMYGSGASFLQLLGRGVTGPNHYFVPSDDFTYK